MLMARWDWEGLVFLDKRLQQVGRRPEKINRRQTGSPFLAGLGVSSVRQKSEREGKKKKPTQARQVRPIHPGH